MKRDWFALATGLALAALSQASPTRLPTDGASFLVQCTAAMRFAASRHTSAEPAGQAATMAYCMGVAEAANDGAVEAFFRTSAFRQDPVRLGCLRRLRNVPEHVWLWRLTTSMADGMTPDQQQQAPGHAAMAHSMRLAAIDCPKQQH
ncbi:MAG: hypothetical protein RR100_27405 [Comamonas sp.]